MRSAVYALLAAVVFAAGPASAQSSHMAKVTCGEFLKSDKQQKALLIMWLRGYHSGKRGDIETATDEQSPAAYGGKLGRRCTETPSAPLLTVSEEILAEGEH